MSAEDYNVYLPIILNPPPEPSDFGVYDECQGGYAKYYNPVSRVVFPVSWGESVPGSLSSVAKLHWTMACIREVPEEFREWPDKVCSRPREDAFEHYVQFALQVAATGVKAIEIGNEPNQDNSGLSFINCWGTKFTDGMLYGRLATMVFQALQLHFPRVQLVIGSLIPKKCDFIDGMFSSAYGFFHRVSFHCYARFGIVWTEVESFTNYLKGRTNVPFILSETAVIHEGDCSDSGFLAAQVDHWDFVRSRIKQWGVEWFSWYPIGGNKWKCTDLMIMGPGTPVYLLRYKDCK